MNLPVKKGYRKLHEQLKNKIRDVEHYRGTYMTSYKKSRIEYTASGERHVVRDTIHAARPVHVAVVVLNDNYLYIGEARLNHRDEYNRGLGFEVAMGKALHKAVSVDDPDAIIDPNIRGVALRDACRAIAEHRLEGVLLKGGSTEEERALAQEQLQEAIRASQYEAQQSG